MTQRSHARRGGTFNNNDSELQTRADSGKATEEVAVRFKEASLKDEGGLLRENVARHNGIERRTSISVSTRSHGGESVKKMSMV